MAVLTKRAVAILVLSFSYLHYIYCATNKRTPGIFFPCIDSQTGLTTGLTIRDTRSSGCYKIPNEFIRAVGYSSEWIFFFCIWHK